MTLQNPLRKPYIKGYIFEVVIQFLLKQNGWKVQVTGDTDKYRGKSPFSIEIKGRGTWHQIDAPCLFERNIPFMYPLRLLSEMKFYHNEISKKFIREYIGVIKDISENYFIDDDKTTDNQSRYTDIGAFFSANGFDIEASNLGFVHGIRLISYKTNQVVSDLKDKIHTMVMSDYPSSSKLKGTGRLAKFKRELSRFLDADSRKMESLQEFSSDETDMPPILYDIRNTIRGIKSSFTGTTSNGLLIHFLGTDIFPDSLFEATDEQECKVYYNEVEKDIQMWLTFSNDTKERKFHFDVPPRLEEAIKTQKEILDQKERHFAYISIYKVIDKKMRLLTLKLDTEWLEYLKRKKREVG